MCYSRDFHRELWWRMPLVSGLVGKSSLGKKPTETNCFGRKKVCDENVTKNRNEVTFSTFQFILVVYLSVWRIFADANFMVVFLCSLCGLHYGWYVLWPNQIEPRKKLPLHSRHDGRSSFIFTVSNNLSIAGVCSSVRHP